MNLREPGARPDVPQARKICDAPEPLEQRAVPPGARQIALAQARHRACWRSLRRPRRAPWRRIEAVLQYIARPATKMRDHQDSAVPRPAWEGQGPARAESRIVRRPAPLQRRMPPSKNRQMAMSGRIKLKRSSCTS